MELARSHRVHLVTMDRGFYKDKKDVTKGLADNLREECAKAGYYVCLHGTIASCLSEMGEDAVSLPPNELAKLIDDRLDKSLLASTAEERNYWLTGERIGQAITTFPTLEPQRDALTFELTYRLADRAEDESAIRLQPSLTVKGTSFYDKVTKQISDPLVDEGVFLWTDASGSEHKNTDHYVRVSGGMHFGGSA